MKKTLNNIGTFLFSNIKFILTIIIIVFLFEFDLPYRIYTPGGMVDLSSRITVENGYSSEGKLGMSYVTMIRGCIPYLALSYVIPDWDIVPESRVKYDNETMEETLKGDKIATKQSIDSAIIAAYQYAGKDIDITKVHLNITYLDSDTDTDLKLFDDIFKIDNQELNSLHELREIISKHHDGDKVMFKVNRDGVEKDCYAFIKSVDNIPIVGMLITDTYDYTESPVASIKMESSESGPSGGLMMSLAIYNSLVSDDITKGHTVVGTGTIDQDGNVGEIGGVRYKLIGAVKNKADVFLVPEENYDEAMKVKEEKKYTINIISVKTFAEAVEALKKLDDV